MSILSSRVYSFAWTIDSITDFRSHDSVTTLSVVYRYGNNTTSFAINSCIKCYIYFIANHRVHISQYEDKAKKAAEEEEQNNQKKKKEVSLFTIIIIFLLLSSQLNILFNNTPFE